MKKIIAFFALFLLVGCLDDSTHTFPLRQLSMARRGYMSGSFFLGIGSISGGTKMIAYAIVDTGKGILRPITVNMGDVRFVEDGKNFVEITHDGRYKICALLERYAIKRAVFHIPQGSVIRMYNPNFIERKMR